MARIIFHSRYFKPNMQGREAVLSNLMEYIGTREGVELMGERWKTEPESKSQKDMIARLLKDVPELRDTHEWEDYAANPTKGNASEVITMGTELVLYNTGKVENYVDYIANRPRVDKEGKQHGLFTQTDGNINLAATARAVAEHPGNVWTNVISLRREDAERLGYNNADAWRTLVRAKAAELAKGMKIPFSDFQWYAAFHNESHHPHIHMVCYSTGKEGMLTKKGIEEIKSSLASEIFAQDLLQVYTKQTEIRNDLKEVAERYLQLARELPKEAANLTSLEPLIADIHRRLPDHGRMQYGYMPRDVKNLVDAAVDVLATNEKISELYDLWYEQKCAVIATYTLKMPEKEPLSDNEAFRSIKNAVIRMAQEYEPPWVKLVENLNSGETVWELPEDGELSQVGPGSEIFLDLVRGTGDVTNGNAVVPGNVGEELAEAKAPQEPVKESPFVAREKRARAELEEKLARILQEMQERNAAAKEQPEAEKPEEADGMPGTNGRERMEETLEEAEMPGPRGKEQTEKTSEEAETPEKTETPEKAEALKEEEQPESAKPVSWETAAEGFARETREQPEKPEKLQGAASGETAEYGRKRRKAPKNQFHDFEQREYTPEQWAAIERKMRGIARPGDEEIIARREKRKEPDFWSKQREDETPRNRFHDFEQRDYDREDWDNIEKIMMLRDAPEKEEALEALFERYDEKQALRDSAGDVGNIPNPWTKQFKEARSHYRKEEFDEAYRLFRREHQSGNPLGSLWLAQMTERGLGTEANEAEEETLYEQSAKGFLRLYEMCGKVEGRSGLKERERDFADFLKNYLPFRIGKLHARKEEYAEAAEWYQKSDTPYAKYSLGGLYERGQGIEKNRETAFTLYKAAADSGVGRKERKGGEQKNEGFPFAEYKVAVMTGDAGEREEYYKRAFAGFEALSEKDDADDTVFYRLAEMLRQGAGTEQDLDRAVAYYEKAVAMENIYAKYRLGTLLLDAEQAFFAPERGLQLLLEAADKEPRAYYFLGKLYLKGEVVEASREIGLAYLRKAAEQGYDMAQYRLGRDLLEGEGTSPAADVTEEQLAEGLSWLKKAADQENPYAQYYLGKLYLTGEYVEANWETGLAYLRKAAEQGYNMAQYRLGRDLLEAEDATEEQTGEGLSWLRKAAEQENPYAQYYLGKLYLTGEHVEANRKIGLLYLRKAAEQGYDMAQYWLGKELAYADGAGKEQVAEGMEWLKAAAEQKNVSAMYLLAKTYIQGKLVPRELELGMQYLHAAADEGMELAQMRLQKGIEDWLHEYQPQILPGCIRLLGQIGRIFETQRPGRGVGGIDRKLLREMQEKKEAMGLRM